jgi:hypothetical protein
VFPSEPCLRQFTPIAGNRQLDTSKNRLILA